MTQDEVFMQRALSLAVNGLGTTRPNPVVGCIIVHNRQIIGEGWHKTYGQAHAEVLAIAQVQNKALLPESTVYVTLEPCAHFGKTPPCADLLIANKVKRVVICNTDPNPLVSGKGIAKLKETGIDVEQGVLSTEGHYINRRFFTYQTSNRPYIVLKWAQTADGFIAREDFTSKWISGTLARVLVHKWRSEEAAILVGTNTALHDNPSLTTRDWSGSQPLRLVLDRTLKLPPTANLLDNSLPTIVFTAIEKANEQNLQYIKIDFSEGNFVKNLMSALTALQVQSVLVEGGSKLLQTLLAANIWDEARVFTSPSTFTSGIAAPNLPLSKLKETHAVGNDTLHVFYN